MKYLLAALFFVQFIVSHALALDVKQFEIEGKKAWLVEDSVQPVIYLNFSFPDAGSRYDPEGKSGLANFMSSMLNKGTTNYSAEKFKQLLDSHAIELESYTANNSLTVTLKTLTEHADVAFNLLREYLLHPRFDENEIEIMRSRLIQYTKRQKESPSHVANEHWNQTLFGTHPYSRDSLGTEASLKTITQKDISEFRTQAISNNMVISLSGDVTERSAKKLLSPLLAELSTSTRTTPDAFTNYPAGSVKRVSKDVPQSTIIFGHEGLPINHPDFYAFYALNHIVGAGGFSSRLMYEIREKRGLAYSAYSYLHMPELASYLKGSIATKNESVDEVLKQLNLIWTDVHTNGITEQELRAAKRYLLGSYYIDRLDTNPNLLNYLSFLQTKNLSVDFITKRNEMIAALTLEDVNRAARTYLLPGKLHTVVVGK